MSAPSAKKRFIDAVWLSNESTAMKLFLLCIARFFDPLARGSSMSFAQVARECSLGESTAKRCAQRATREGWLLIERGKGHPTSSGPTNLYHGVIPEGANEWAKGSRRETPLTHGVSQGDPMGSRSGTRTSDSTLDRERSLSPNDKTILPESWSLPDNWRVWTTRTFNASSDALERSARLFRLFKGAEPRTAEEWFRAWQIWCRREDLFRDKAGKGAARTDSGEVPDAAWRQYVRVFGDEGLWPTILVGPAPGEPGCRCPPHILAERKTGAAA